MNDPCLNLLLSRLDPNSRTLWFAAEGHEPALPVLKNHSQLHVVTNRFDFFEQAQATGVNCSFSDWQLDEPLTFDACHIRIGKEKPVNLHWLYLANKHLAARGKLFICGEKNEGVKSFAKTAAATFSTLEPISKHGEAYLSVLDRPQNSAELADQYSALQTVALKGFDSVYSKPGVYGWNKVDAGSALLIETVAPVREQFNGKSLLDLGCGYGYLTIASRDWPFARRSATDNNAGALECMTANARLCELDVSVTAGNCGNSLQSKFDVILCNPPFHTGFDVDGDLTHRFIAACRRLLHKAGVAYLVVNSFIPIEKKATRAFSEITILANNGKFKVVSLSKPQG